MINLLVELLHSVLIHEIIRNNWCLIYDISSPEIRRSDQSWPRHKILHCPYCEHVCRWALSYLLIISNSGCYLLIITCGRQDVIMSHWWIANYSTDKYKVWPSPSAMLPAIGRWWYVMFSSRTWQDATNSMERSWRIFGAGQDSWVLEPRCSVIGPDLWTLHHCPGESWASICPNIWWC